jgi:hypothetical protein
VLGLTAAAAVAATELQCTESNWDLQDDPQLLLLPVLRSVECSCIVLQPAATEPNIGSRQPAGRFGCCAWVREWQQLPPAPAASCTAAVHGAWSNWESTWEDPQLLLLPVLHSACWLLHCVAGSSRGASPTITGLNPLNWQQTACRAPGVLFLAAAAAAAAAASACCIAVHGPTGICLEGPPAAAAAAASVHQHGQACVGVGRPRIQRMAASHHVPVYLLFGMLR